MTKILSSVNAVVWGVPALVLILGVGLYLSLRLGFAQIRLLPRAFREFGAKLRPGKKAADGVSPFQALCTALAATVGTGNLVGVAGAICLGGPGAIFWMWVCGILGMATKYTEVTLALRYREKTESGWLGGPMQVIARGLGKKFLPLAKVYCLFGVIAAFGVGNAAQINAVVTGVNGVLERFGGSQTQAGNLAMGLALAVLIGMMLLGGAKRIGAAAERLVPFAACGYILMCVGVLLAKAQAVPGAFSAILRGAFCPRAVTGGMLGSAFQALRIGCSRGVFTNEAGMGTASIAHASAEVAHPAEQGLMGILEVFLDTLVICTLTAITIIVSGVEIGFGVKPGSELITAALATVFGEKFAALFVAISLMLFAFSTVLGWSLYGSRCVQYLCGTKSIRVFQLLFVAVIVVGCVSPLSVVWDVADTFNGLMAIPNFIALFALSGVVAAETKKYFKQAGKR